MNAASALSCTLTCVLYVIGRAGYRSEVAEQPFEEGHLVPRVDRNAVKYVHQMPSVRLIAARSEDWFRRWPYS